MINLLPLFYSLQNTSGAYIVLSEIFEAYQQGGQPLDFTLFVPPGFGKIGQTPVPNVIETDDPNKIFSAVFGKNRELWTTDFNLK